MNFRCYNLQKYKFFFNLQINCFNLMLRIDFFQLLAFKNFFFQLFQCFLYRDDF